MPSTNWHFYYSCDVITLRSLSVHTSPHPNNKVSFKKDSPVTNCLFHELLSKERHLLSRF